ncbi:MAG: transglutaminase domain-containing protein, partial [Planctomycetes bacterium]|nr:transglutaminase domain-containing protein [Planctomycetota bacterium]
MRTRLDTRGALRSVACTLGVFGAVLAAAVFGGFALGACRAANPASATGSVASTPDASARDSALRERTLAYLREHMPERDRATLPAGFLEEHVALALQARAEFPWAAEVPEELFLNDVAPYAVLDEPRDPWRRELLELCRPIVAECRTATEAAQALNRELFKTIGLHYNTERERANQSFVESKKSGKASCTGLSIALVDACRAVGIPARAAGTPKWTKKDGNHTWVEVWDGAWHFAGADEYDASGLDRGWFVGDASDARADRPENRIYATSWARAGVHFPLAWNPADTSVAAVDVTARYAKASEPMPAQTFVRVFAKRGGERIAAEVELVDASGAVLAGVTSRAGTSDLNDMPSFATPSDGAGTLRVRFGGVERSCSLAQARGAT